MYRNRILQKQSAFPLQPDDQMFMGQINNALAWGIATNAGCVTNWHMDTGGAGTYALVLHGCKLWAACQPLPLDILDYEAGEYFVQKMNTENEVVVCIFLEEGDCL